MVQLTFVSGKKVLIRAANIIAVSDQGDWREVTVDTQTDMGRYKVSESLPTIELLIASAK